LDRLATSLSGSEAQRLQVVAYAASQGNNSSAARRLSLSRALAVRSYLIDKGIRSTRIDVRAMGAPEGANSGPADRVDLVLVSQ
jgi:outer membrane protein OmpA-like peptidoglycan-associated protein